MKQILLTGGAGFIGFSMLKKLAVEDNHIVVIDNMSRGANDSEFQGIIDLPNVDFINMDLTDKNEFGKIVGCYDYVYHFAALNGTKNFYERPEEVLRINILSLLNILEWATPEKCGKFLFSSSSEAYAATISTSPNPDSLIPTKENIALSIDDVYNPRYSYGGSKITGELLTINYCNVKKIPFTILRYHNIYGGRMGFDHVIPEFCYRIYKKEIPFIINGGNDTRAFCYIDDAVEATQLSMESTKCNNQIIHIGNEREETDITTLAQILFKYNNYEPHIEARESPKGSVRRRCPDTSKLKNLTGFEARISLYEGLEFTNAWYMDRFKEEEDNGK